MASVYESLLRQIDKLAVDVAALKILEGAGTAGGGVSGSGVTNRIAQWSGASSLSASTLIKSGVGVLTLSAASDYTLTVPGTGTVLLEATAATTYLKLDASNDPLTSGLAITGSADEIQLAVKANGTQNANLVEFQNSAGSPTLYVTSNNDLYFAGKTAYFEDASTPITAWRSGGTSTMLYTVYTDNTTNGGRIRLQGAGGTVSSPTPVLNNYTIGELQAFGYINGAFRQMFVMRAAAVNTISSTSYPTNVYFIVTLQGATTGTTMMTLHNSGYVGVNTGTGTPRGMLGVIARATTDVVSSFKGASSHTGDLTRWENASNVTMSLIDANGGLVINEHGGNAAALRVETDTETDMIKTDPAGDLLYLGGSTNGIQIAKGGALTLIGTAVYERHIQLNAHTVGNPSDAPDQDDIFTAGALIFTTTGSHNCHVQFEVPDDWDGGDMYLEADTCPTTAISGTDTVKWDIEYRSVAEGEAINNGTSATVSITDSADYAQYATKHQRFTLAYNHANQPLTAQDHVYIKFSRDTSVANDFGGSVGVTAFELIYNSTSFPRSN